MDTTIIHRVQIVNVRGVTHLSVYPNLADQTLRIETSRMAKDADLVLYNMLSQNARIVRA